jgi:hypothetical protein
VADKDYTQVGRDTTAITKDYTKIGKSQPILGKDYTQIPDVGPNMQKLMNDTQLFLKDRGYPPDSINALMTPIGSLQNPMALDTLYREIKPTFERNIKGIEEALKMSQAINEEFGTQPSFKETEALISLFQRFGAEALDGVSDAHKWWMGAKRRAGDVAADKFSGTMVNVGLGMALLDSIDAFDKEGFGPIPGKLDVLRANIPGTQVIPKDEIHDIENRVMPSLQLDDRGRKLEFDTSTAAALWVLGQRLYAFGERRFADLAQLPLPGTQFKPLLARWQGTEPINEFFDNMREQAAEREQIAVGVIPPLVSSLGQPSTKIGSGITWMEIAERKVGLEKEFDSMYKWMDDKGALGDVTMGTWAMLNGAIDAIAVPSTIVAGLTGKIPSAVTRVTKALPGGQAKIAKLAVERAHSTKRFDDTFEALSEAQRHFDDVDAKYKASVSENLRATGETKVAAPVWREWMLARRQLNNVKQLVDNMKDPSEMEVLLQTPRRHPKMLQAPPDDASPVSKEIHKHRKDWLERGPSQSPNWSEADLPAFQQRKVFGPDDVEQAASGLEAMHKTGGEAVDDIMITGVMPEYQVTPARGPIDFLDWSNVPKIKARGQAEQRFIDSISGKGLPEYPGQPRFTLKNSSLRMLLQEEDIIRRNLGTARNLKQAEAIRIHTKNLEEIRGVIDKIKNKGLSKDAQVYDDILLPEDSPTIMNNAERFNRWINMAGDRVLRGLYPGSMQIGFFNSTMGQLHALTRHDPVRYYQAMSPETWDFIRLNILRESQSNAAWINKSREMMMGAGIFKKLKKFDIKKATHDYDLDDVPDKIMYDFANTKPTDPEFTHLREALPKEMVEVHDHFREIMDAAADMQGIRGDRYLEGYIHHMVPKSLFDQGARPLAGMGLPRNVELFAAHLMKRKGNAGYKRSFAAAMELYGRFMHRKMYREPVYEAIKKTGDDLYAKTGNAAHRYFADMFVRQMEGKPGFLGEMLDAFIGSTVKASGRSWAPDEIGRRLMGVTGLAYMSMLGGNPRYALMQISTAIPTTAMRFGLFRTIGGIFKMATREGQALAKEAGVYQSFISVLEAPEMRKISQFIFEKWPAITPFGPMTNAKAEFFVRGMTLHAALGSYLNKAGLSTLPEAAKAGLLRSIQYEALKASEEINHMYGALGRNPAITRMFGQGFSMAATQFLSFIPKQTDELLSQALRNPGMIAKYLMISGWASKIAAEDLGIDITDYTGLGYLPREGADISSPGADLLMNLINYADAFNEYDPKRVDLAARNLLDAASNAIPAKIQVTSAMKAANRLREGKISTAEGQLLSELDFAGQSGLDLIRPPSEHAPGIGGEFLPTVLMQKNMRERLLRRGLEFARKDDARFLHAMQTALTDFANAVEAGDDDAANNLADELENTYKIRISSTAPIERALEARYINEVIRYWSPEFGGDKKLLGQRLETLRRYGIGPTGEQ